MLPDSHQSPSTTKHATRFRRFGANERCSTWTEQRRIVLLHTAGPTVTGADNSFLGHWPRTLPFTYNEAKDAVEFLGSATTAPTNHDPPSSKQRLTPAHIGTYGCELRVVFHLAGIWH